MTLDTTLHAETPGRHRHPVASRGGGAALARLCARLVHPPHRVLDRGDRPPGALSRRLGVGLLLIVYFGLEWLYPIVFELLPGAATPGKRALGLQVMMDDRCRSRSSAACHPQPAPVGRLPLPVAFAFGLLSMMLRRDFKRLGDIVAGTLVVHGEHVRLAGALPEAESLAPRVPLTRAAGRHPPPPAVLAADDGARRRTGRARRERLAGARLRARWHVAAADPPGPAPAGRRAVADGATLDVAHAPPIRGPLRAGLGRARARPQRARTRPGRRQEAAQAQGRPVPDRHHAAAGAARIAQLYRQCCEHLALARERAYPVHLVARLETLTARAHQRIYRRHDFGLGALRDLILYDAPAAVRCAGTC